MIVSILSLGISVAALLTALRRPRPKPPRKPVAPPKTLQQRQQEAVARREWENFMSYDGTEQMPIDPDRVLGEPRM